MGEFLNKEKIFVFLVIVFLIWNKIVLKVYYDIMKLKLKFGRMVVMNEG